MNNPVTNIATAFNVALITVDNLPGSMKVVSDIFNSIAKNNINVDMICQSPPYRGSYSLSFTISSDDLVNAISILNQFRADIPQLKVGIDADNTKISVYGESMRNIPGVAARLFTILYTNGVEVKLVTTSEVSISYLVNEKDVSKAIIAIKDEYSLK